MGRTDRHIPTARKRGAGTLGMELTGSNGVCGMWIESHQSLGRHPKLIRLAAKLKISRAQAVGHLHYLWWWAMDFAPDGDLSRFAPEEIASGAEWAQSARIARTRRTLCAPEVFVSALRGDWIDADGFLHDWHQYAGKLIEKREKDRLRKRDFQRNSNGTPTEVAGTTPTTPTTPTAPTSMLPLLIESLRGQKRVENPEGLARHMIAGGEIPKTVDLLSLAKLCNRGEVVSICGVEVIPPVTQNKEGLFWTGKKMAREKITFDAIEMKGAA